MKNVIAERVQTRLEALGMSAHRAAVSAGLEKSYIANLIDGTKASISAAHIPEVAKVLECSVGYLLGTEAAVAADRQDTIPMAGKVARGIFQKYPAPADGPSTMAPDPRFEPGKQAAFKVLDDHARAVGIVAGSLICVLLGDVAMADFAIAFRPGDLLLGVKMLASEGAELSVYEVAPGASGKVLIHPGEDQAAEVDAVIGRVVAVSRVL